MEFRNYLLHLVVTGGAGRKEPFSGTPAETALAQYRVVDLNMTLLFHVTFFVIHPSESIVTVR